MFFLLTDKRCPSKQTLKINAVIKREIFDSTNLLKKKKEKLFLELSKKYIFLIFVFNFSSKQILLLPTPVGLGPSFRTRTVKAQNDSAES